MKGLVSYIKWANINKLGIKHPWVKRIYVCSNGQATPFTLGDNKIAKVHLRNLKFF